MIDSVIDKNSPPRWCCAQCAVRRWYARSLNVALVNGARIRDVAGVQRDSGIIIIIG